MSFFFNSLISLWDSLPSEAVVSLAEDHILTWTRPGDVVLDPFNGSGTTTKMAFLNDRNFIGLEISPDYCEISEQRLLLAKDAKEQNEQETKKSKSIHGA